MGLCAGSSRENLYRLKWCIAIVQDHQSQHQWMSIHMQIPINIPLQYACVLSFSINNALLVESLHFAVFTHLCFIWIFWNRCSGVPLGGGTWKLTPKTWITVLPNGKNCKFLWLLVLIQYQCVTYRHRNCDVYVGGKVRVLELMRFFYLKHSGSKINFVL